jgi:hypothetical protein
MHNKILTLFNPLAQAEKLDESVNAAIGLKA